MNDLRFIDLITIDFHSKEENLLVVNINKIVYLLPDSESEDTIIGLGLEGDFRVKESVEDIKKLITKAAYSSNVFQT